MKKIFFISIALLIFTFQYTCAASRFWIGGSSGTWNNTVNWSATSGGAGGAGIPGNLDDVIFDANSGGLNITPDNILFSTIHSLAIKDNINLIIDADSLIIIDSLNVFNGVLTLDSATIVVYGLTTINDSLIISGQQGMKIFDDIIIKNGGRFLNSVPMNSVVITEDIIIENGSEWDNGNGTLRVFGNFHNDGIFEPGTSTFAFWRDSLHRQTITGNSTQNFFDFTIRHDVQFNDTVLATGIDTLNIERDFLLGGNFIAPSHVLNIYGNLDFTGHSLTAGDTINIYGDWIRDTHPLGNEFVPGTGTVFFKGTNQVIRGTVPMQNFNHLNVDSAQVSVNLISDSLVLNNLTINQGVFNAPQKLNILGSVLFSSGQFESGSNVYVSGNWTNNMGTFGHNGGTVYFDSTSTHTIDGSIPTEFYNLRAQGTFCPPSCGSIATRVMTDTKVFNILTINNTAVLEPDSDIIFMLGNTGDKAITGNGSIKVTRIVADSADLLNQYKFDTYDLDSMTVMYAGNGRQTINAKSIVGSYGSLVIMDSTKTLDSSIVVNGDIIIYNDTLDANNFDIYCGGNWNNIGGAFKHSNRTITFNNSSAITGLSPSFNNVIITAGATLTGHGSNMRVAGDWTNNGTFAHNNGKVSFRNVNNYNTVNGSSITSFYKMSIDNPDGIVFTNSSIINDSLIFVNGKIFTQNNSLILDYSAPVSGADSSRYIAGNEQLNIPSGIAINKTFYIGDTSAYAPVDLSIVSTTNSGYIVAFTDTGNSPNADITIINPNANVNRYWNLNNNGVEFDSCQLTFSFNNDEIDTGADPSKFIVKRFNVPTNSWQMTALLAHNANSTGCTVDTISLGDFEIGEPNFVRVHNRMNDINASLLPNPNNGIFDLIMEGTVSGDIDVDLFNTLGVLVYRQTVFKDTKLQSFHFNISDFPGGLYLLKFSVITGESGSVKLMIK